MTKTILTMILGAINASCWWSLFTGNVHPNIMVPVVLFTILTTAVCLAVLAVETISILDKPTNK
jgi:hypothetical protein